MKTKRKSNRNTIWMVVLIMLLMVSCKKDDDSPNLFINATTPDVEINGLNNCNTSTGSGTIQTYRIPYTASIGVEIAKVHTHLEASNGDTRDEVTALISDDGSSIEVAECFRYGSLTWIDYTFILESNDGIVSNETTLRVNRPNGAN